MGKLCFLHVTYRVLLLSFLFFHMVVEYPLDGCCMNLSAQSDTMLLIFVLGLILLTCTIVKLIVLVNFLLLFAAPICRQVLGFMKQNLQHFCCLQLHHAISCKCISYSKEILVLLQLLLFLQQQHSCRNLSCNKDGLGDFIVHTILLALSLYVYDRFLLIPSSKPTCLHHHSV